MRDSGGWRMKASGSLSPQSQETARENHSFETNESTESASFSRHRMVFMTKKSFLNSGNRGAGSLRGAVH